MLADPVSGEPFEVVSASPRRDVGQRIFLFADEKSAHRFDADPEQYAAPPPPDEVILLHGLGRGTSSMRPLVERLEREGYVVHNLSYPSTREGPAVLVDHLASQVRECCDRAQGALHFVTYSLGGIIVRAFLEREPPARLGRVVMLAPPNGGSELVDKWGDTWLFGALLGPTAKQLGTDAESLPNRLGPPDYELGVIAGNRSYNPLGSKVLPGKDDGTVAVARTRVEGMKDFLVVPQPHTFIMRGSTVGEQVVHFLRYGRFRATPD